MILIELFQWYIADAIASFIISILILASVIPLVKSSAEILLQSYPKKYEKKLMKLLENVKNEAFYFNKNYINKIPEITSCRDINLWAYTSNYLVLTICVTINQESNDEEVTKQLKKIIKKFHQIKHSTIQIQRDSDSAN